MRALVVLSALFTVFWFVVSLRLLIKDSRIRKWVLLWLRRKDTPIEGRAFGLVLVGTPVVLAGLYGMWHLIPRLSGAYSRVIVGTVVVMVLSCLLFIMKVKALRWYALVELIFALTVSATTLYSLNDVESPLRLVGIGTAIYLIIRGLDNFKKDLDERLKIMKERSAQKTTNVVPATPAKSL